MTSAHDRGRDYPSSLESAHHIDQNGKVIYSPAQIQAIKQGENIDRSQASEANKIKSVAEPAGWLSHEAVREDWREETLPSPLSGVDEDSVTEDSNTSLDAEDITRTE